MAQILIEDRRQIHIRMQVEPRNHIVRHDVLVLEVLVEAMEQLPPFGIVVHHAAQRVEHQRAFEVLILRRLGIHAAFGNNGAQDCKLSASARSNT